MNIAYVFSTQGHAVSYNLGKMILPQLEGNGHDIVVIAWQKSPRTRRFC